MICLGIESTAHTFGISVIKYTKKLEVLSNVRDLYTTESGDDVEGMIPFKVSQHHLDCCDSVFKKSLELANVKLSDIDLISFSQSPGLGHTLRIGSMFAKFISRIYDIPIVGVNHCIAHLEIGRALAQDSFGKGCKDPVLLYASGANTQIIAYAEGKYRIFGESLDIGVGNFLDTLARYMGLGFPGGPKLYELSKKFTTKNHRVINVPYSVKGMDVNFGGILTFLKRKYDSKEYNSIEIAYSAQEYVFAMLIEVSERAMAHCGKTELLLGGGVACNLRLQEMAKIMCSERNGKCFILPNEFNVDNAAMIAYLGCLVFKSTGPGKIEDLDISPYLRTDDVDVTWR
ncbi:tRNA (adenosine(37)-N6)-threonylcarbamoyltransferase complex transferase subunit TsaD [Candidatus Woesearchaeota archaeon]|nr:tRNA (adenosine(37)-N6)-threonylcarbamoyltransferase complex transferase subunit TsaD [Candidatus Woesearchaeota archaeon]